MVISPFPMLDVGDEVTVIAGTYRGREATISGKTSKMYYIKLSSGDIVRVMKSSVARLSLSATDWQQQVLEELRLIRQNTETMVALLSQLKL